MIGLFIGSFNPPTKAHLDICQILKFRFKKIVLVPVNSNNKKLISLRDRINMLNILSRKNKYLEVSNIMQDYSFLNYRIIDLLKKKYHDINIIMGSDLLDKLDTFDNYKYLLSNYSFTILTRDRDVKKIINDKYSDYINKFKILDYNSSISSTMVREYLSNKKEPKNILDKDVLDYIKKNNLY